MSRHLLAISYFCGFLTIVCAPTNADVFLLTNGGQVEGTLLNPKESPREVYIVEPLHGGRLVLQPADVDRFVVKSDVEIRYEEALPQVEDSEAGHWEMAKKCEAAGLKEQQEFHLQQVLRHDTEHEPARRALGYNRVDGRWQRPNEYMAEQGFIRHRGGWRLPQELAIEKRERDNERETLAWRKNVKLWRDWIIKGRDRAAQGLANMRAIRDPRSATALAAQLRQSKEPRALKQLYIDVLAYFPENGTGIGAMTYVALHDADGQVREKALDVLSSTGSRVATLAFMKALGDNENKMVQRAGFALGYMKQPEMTTLKLIDSLITEHKYTVGGGGITPSFGSGGSGLSMGGKPKTVKKNVQNQAVLHALTGMHQGVNFGFDQEAWRRWYVQNNTPRDVNLRRSN
ncbi:MAG: hypothetical protein H8E66_11310 [Planctomycetes bacterium]|nr:hypothetical protein [Planctomycetota bacterium]